LHEDEEISPFHEEAAQHCNQDHDYADYDKHGESGNKGTERRAFRSSLVLSACSPRFLKPVSLSCPLAKVKSHFYNVITWYDKGE
jgi:hypothetical protein